MDNPFDDIFGTLFQNATQPPSLHIDQEVTAELSKFVTVYGVLTKLPTATMQFCVVDGTITKSGRTSRDTRILVPLNLLKPKK